MNAPDDLMQVFYSRITGISRDENSYCLSSRHLKLEEWKKILWLHVLSLLTQNTPGFNSAEVNSLLM